MRNCLCLTTDEDALLQAAGLLHLWGSGYVEPIEPPPSPRHLVAQQVLALVLQEGRVGDRVVWSTWGDLLLLDDTAPAVLAHLVTQRDARA